MAAPESTPELSVVSDETNAGSEPAVASRPAVSTQEAPVRRRGAPWWLVVVVAVLGLILFLNQYQRAARLDARVVSLSEELGVADQRLELATGQITAQRAHLDQVRSGIAELSQQVSGLQALAGRDPLAPAAAASPVESTATPAASAPGPVVEPSSTGIERQEDMAALTDADGFYWRAEGAPTESAPAEGDLERSAVLHGAIGTPFSSR